MRDDLYPDRYYNFVGTVSLDGVSVSFPTPAQQASETPEPPLQPCSAVRKVI